MLTIGLTGGIGSGKSTVARLFAELGIAIIDADMITRQLTEPGQAAYKAIVAHFGITLLEDSRINRAALRHIIFSNPLERQWLESLLHPLVRQEIEHQVRIANSPYCIVAIPLLIESKPNPLIERILIVDTTEALQIKRSIARDRQTQAEIEEIMQTQVSREQRLAAADDIITNDKNIDDLAPQVKNLHSLYLQLANRQEKHLK